MTYDALSVLGIDPDSLSWRDLALCGEERVPTAMFYELYERVDEVPPVVDQMCLSCPVRSQCLEEGIENKEWGVWGGVFLFRGEFDETKNSHKGESIWAELSGALND